MENGYVLAFATVIIAHFIFPDDLGRAKFGAAVFDAGEQCARGWRCFVGAKHKSSDWRCRLIKGQSEEHPREKTNSTHERLPYR